MGLLALLMLISTRAEFDCYFMAGFHICRWLICGSFTPGRLFDSSFSFTGHRPVRRCYIHFFVSVMAGQFGFTSFMCNRPYVQLPRSRTFCL